MIITLLIPSLVGCGAERVIVNLANYLSDRGHEVKILNYYYSDCPFKLRNNINRCYLYKRQNKATLIKKLFIHFFTKAYLSSVVRNRLRKLKHFIKNNRTDCYLVMLESATIDLLKLRRYITCPIIASERNYPENYPEIVKKQLYQLSVNADAYVFQTKAAKACYGPSIRKNIVIPNAVNEDFMNISASVYSRRKTIINAGRLEQQKNQALLIKAFQKSGLSDYTLEIYGEGPLRNQLQEQIDTLGLNNIVFLKGYTDQIKSVMSEASLFALSSDYEGIPNVLLEAMATGLPCITTDFAGGGAHTLIDEGKTGIIVPKGDETALANAMRNILTNRELYQQIAENAKKKIEQFNPETIYAKWEQFIEEVVNAYS